MASASPVLHIKTQQWSSFSLCGVRAEEAPTATPSWAEYMAAHGATICPQCRELQSERQT